MGKPNNIPAKGEIAAINPVINSLVFNAFAKSDKTGFFESVVENILKNPINAG
jgi:hypothetical protein